MSARVVTGSTVARRCDTLPPVRAEDWDVRYEQRRQWSEGPNALVAELLGSLPPGVAVDLAAGEGRHGSFADPR